GVSLGVVKNDIFHWQAIVEGLPETPWEGGIFQLELFFDEDYNEVPPDIYFVTVPFHPNVDMKDGRPCIPFLTDESEWNSNTPLPNILLQLQFLLANPGLDQPVNIAAAEIYTSAPHLYEQLIRDSVIASRRIRGKVLAIDMRSLVVALNLIF
ncbi:ubiquitin-conjugating enzyme/RWD-like protein, partial [Gaertneriomyces semiglobifer]